MASYPNGRTSSPFTESYEFYSSDFARLSIMSDALRDKVDANYDDILDALEDLHEIPNILREGILFTGGAVAILLQAAARGVLEEKSTLTNGAGRPNAISEQLYHNLYTTVIYLHGLTFGTRSQRKQVLDRTHSQDQSNEGAKVHGQYPLDPKLRLWVTATLYATATEVYQRVFEKLDLQRAERVYYEFSLMAVGLNLSKDSWPQSRKAFWDYWDEHIELLDVDPQALPIVDGLEKLRDLPGWLRVSKPFIRNITPEMLPPHVREQYGFQSTSTSRFKYKLYMNGAKAIYPALPSSIRCLPKKRAMKELEDMLQKK
ncbi:hypothetical protein BGW36DRAFT_194260 [Talaromyces proteolyticus]|uniref:ER-bound oxygenase mpaB/mpaB'/Rubber oxygenase catalytic domain-containing protein n=1 Tax=Talaromyces proteolyticus TaxID=1131652 RepID=A0AAD4PYM5_9EURO|nr:uncharacterized protein BGW36DRAFT_194260 [Talaromyces proteolyticus]KAH8694962.1 hypothetical protein BGW36DRAFT_194260 [Talaromyces proteolyticus]